MTKSRGFTIIELLVALGLFLTVAALVVGGVRPQMHTAGSQVRVAGMQSGTRAAFDLLARDLRMAGYGVDLTMPGVPPPVSRDTGSVLILHGNFTNVKTTGSGTGSTVTVPDTTGFEVDNYVVIVSSWGGEAKKITGVGTTNIQLAQPLSRVYPPNSDVTQIQKLQYQIAGGTVLRNGQPMVDGVDSMLIQYYLDDATLVTDPSGVESDVRSTLLNLTTEPVNKPANVTNEHMTVQAEIRIRNLGLSEVVR